MDQLLEATLKQLSAFIHWYYWSSHIGQVIIYVFALGFIVHSNNCTLKFVTSDFDNFLSDSLFEITGKFLLGMALIQMTLGIIGLCVLICTKKLLNIEKPSHNPLKLVYKVLKYA